MRIHEAQHGINLVVDTEDAIVIGRFDHTDGFQVVMHDCAVHPLEGADADAEFVRNAAKYGFAVDRRDLVLDASRVREVRVLGDVPKD